MRNVTDSSGNVTDTETVSKGKAGDDLVLTIDTELQKDVEKLLRKFKGRKGKTEYTVA